MSPAPAEFADAQLDDVDVERCRPYTFFHFYLVALDDPLFAWLQVYMSRNFLHGWMLDYIQFSGLGP